MKQMLLLISATVFLASCNTAPTPDSEIMIQTIVSSTLTAQPTNVPLATPALFTPIPTATIPSPTPTVIDQISEIYQVVAVPNPQSEVLTDVYIRNIDTGKEIVLMSLENIYRNHYHNGEYHNKNLYIIKRIGYEGHPDEDWTDELWCYDSQENEKQVFSAQGLDFRVAYDESYVAVHYSPSDDSSGDKIAFVRVNGSIEKIFNAEALGNLANYYLKPQKWSDSNIYYWGAYQLGPRTHSFFRIDIGSWVVTTYDVSSLPIKTSLETDLNSNTGQIVFSDYPALFDSETAEKFSLSEEIVTLFLYDLNTQEIQTISTSVAKAFRPKWLNDQVIEYNDSKSEDRIKFIIP